MVNLEVLKDSFQTTDSKIVMLVADGLGGLPHPDTKLSELETARTPNLDALASESACGLTVPVMPGVAPGSGPGHLALFGYEPTEYLIGRGALEGLGSRWTSGRATCAQGATSAPWTPRGTWWTDVPEGFPPR